MYTNEQIANALLSGSVGAPVVQPFYPGYPMMQQQVSGPMVQPRYISAPVQAMQQPPMQQPIQYSPEGYSAGDVSYFGIGTTPVAAGTTVTVTVRPLRPFTPQKWGFPSNVQGLKINQVSIGGIGLFAGTAGFPIELLSEVSTFPQIMWPTIDPSVGVEFTVTNPTGGPLNFEGGAYGTQVRI